MILTGPEIKRQVALGEIEIEPFNEDQINPASYDLRLGDRITTYALPSLDSKLQNEIFEYDVAPEGSLLRPGKLYLMHTAERVLSWTCVPVLDGKSSLARLGVSAHLTAGFGDPGFNGQYTLEVTVVHPVIVYAGMRFCQIRFHQTMGERSTYNGNYQGETAMGPVASRSWRQFEKERCICVHPPEEHTTGGCAIFGCSCEWRRK